MEEAMWEAVDFVNFYGIPICDFKIFETMTTPIAKFRSAVKRALKLNNLHNQSRMRFFNLI